MIITAIAKRYAKALFESALEPNRIAEINKDFGSFLTLIDDDVNLKSFLNLPFDAEREQILSKLLKEHFSELFYNFLLLILRNKRFYLISQMRSDFQSRVDAYHRRIHAVAITAFPLPEKKLASISREIGSHLNAEVRLENEVDPAIIGGIILRFEDKMFNASITEQFKKLKCHLIKNQK
jgi:F-type H+-transporting ATPase subunit delta